MPRIPYKKSLGVTAAAALIGMLINAGVPTDTAQQTAQQAITTVEEFEGYVPEAYKDPVGIWTKCFGDTTNVKPGEKYTFEECARSLNTHLAETSTPIMRCVPELAHQDYRVIAAFLSMGYNIGPYALCKSSVARYANDGKWTEACKRMAEIYKTAQGVALPGLELRRNKESQMCLQGLNGGR